MELLPFRVCVKVWSQGEVDERVKDLVGRGIRALSSILAAESGEPGQIDYLNLR